MNRRDGWFAAGEIACEPQEPRLDQPYRLVLLGPPGVGKGTQAKLLSKELRACHLSTGDLLRSAMCEGATTPVMQEALEVMRRGELISDELVIAMVRERSGCLRCRGGFLLDGFPRTVGQAEALAQMLRDEQVPLDAAVCFELPLEDLVDRLSGRRTCNSCQAAFHLTSHPPKVPHTCDHCGGELAQRADDDADAIRVRMRVYEKETRPLIDFYQQQGKLQRVPAVGSPSEIFNCTLSLLRERDSEENGKHRVAYSSRPSARSSPGPATA